MTLHQSSTLPDRDYYIRVKKFNATGKQKLHNASHPDEKGAAGGN